MKPRVLLLTRIPFWRMGAGERTRVLALVWVLGAHCQLSLLYLGALHADELSLLRRLRVQAAVYGIQGPVNEASEREALVRLCAAQNFDACIFQRLALHGLREFLPAGVAAVLDTHDLESRAAESRRSQSVAVHTTLSFEQEVALLSRYERVLLIQAEDHGLVRARLGEVALLAPHPVQFAALPLQAERRHLGLVGSDWAANLHGLDWFADRVWPLLEGQVEGLQMQLYGWLSERWRPEFKAFQRHGFVADFKQAWAGMDVAINPVRWGAGLKIKSVEAMGHGLPLVSTTEGARGMLDGAGTAFLLADEPQAFAEACRTLLLQPQQRAALGEAARRYTSTYFSAQACFGPLLRWLYERAQQPKPQP